MGVRVVGIVSVFLASKNTTQTPTQLDERTPWLRALQSIDGDLLFPTMLEWSLVQQLGGFSGLFQTCSQPHLSSEAAELTNSLGTKLIARGLVRLYSCVHWRFGERDMQIDGSFDMGNASKAAALLQRLLAQHDITARSVLVLTEPSNNLLGNFRTILAASGMPVVTPLDVYKAEPERYSGSMINFESTFAEKELCSQAVLFLGDNRSSFSAHIDALASERRPPPVRAWSASGGGYPLPRPI